MPPRRAFGMKMADMSHTIARLQQRWAAWLLLGEQVPSTSGRSRGKRDQDKRRGREMRKETSWAKMRMVTAGKDLQGLVWRRMGAVVKAEVMVEMEAVVLVLVVVVVVEEEEEEEEEMKVVVVVGVQRQSIASRLRISGNFSCTWYIAAAVSHTVVGSSNSR